MKWPARIGLAAGVVLLLFAGVGLIDGIIPLPLRDLGLAEARVVNDVRPPLPSDDAPRQGESYLRITLSSAQNLIAKGQRGELNIYPLVVECANRDTSFFAYGPFYRGLHVSPLMTDSDNPAFDQLGREQAARYDYQIFVPMTGRLRSESDFNRQMPSYDLRDGGTLCIGIGGGNMLGGHFRSNEVRLEVPRSRVPE
jgi:hypothetical protein